VAGGELKLSVKEKLMESKKVGELIIHMDEYPHVSQDSTLRDAILEIENAALDVYGRKSLPRVLMVTDDDGRLVGIMRRRDILHGLMPSFMSARTMDYRHKLFDVAVDPNLSELSFERLLEGMQSRADKKVQDFMITDVKTVDYDANITTVIFEMVDGNIPLLPVLLNEKVVGIVRSVDVFHEVVRLVM
jgi:CBS domain-containing protein